jgi:cytochrome c oxidase subunit III
MSTAKTGSHDTHHFAHHFDSAEHEYQASKQGIWLFLCTEILMFGAIFVAYSIYKTIYPEVFHAGAQFVDWRWGATNTVVLLLSSFTMAMGIHKIQMNQIKKAIWYLWATVLCGAGFMGIKAIEYGHKIHEGLLPSKYFHYKEPITWHGQVVENAQLYFGFYFSMTGLHGIHVLVGMGLIVWVITRCYRGHFSPNHYTAVEGVGLFWHLVDLIWIYLFPLFYLVG